MSIVDEDTPSYKETHPPQVAIHILPELSSDISNLDKFIKQKLEKAGHSLNEKNNVNILLNPKKDLIVNKEQGAILLK